MVLWRFLSGGETVTHFTKASDLKPFCQKIPQHNVLSHLFVIIIFRHDNVILVVIPQPQLSYFALFIFSDAETLWAMTQPRLVIPKYPTLISTSVFFGVGRRQRPTIL